MNDKPRLTAVGAGDPPTPPARSVSSIRFPYSDLGEAEKAAHHVAESLGRCKPEQLAAWLGHSKLNSGAFRNKMAAARLFGVLTGGRSVVELTGLGRRLVDEGSARQARVEAFLHVPLYRSIYEAHRGKRLPGNLGLELEMVRLGVSRTQVKGARQVFLRSAQQAGFLETGGGQLVVPKGSMFPPAGGEAERDGSGGYPKVIEAILDTAPWGSGWSEKEFDEWARLFLQAARLHFKPSAEVGGP